MSFSLAGLIFELRIVGLLIATEAKDFGGVAAKAVFDN